MKEKAAYLFTRVNPLPKDDGPIGAVAQLLQGHIPVHGTHVAAAHQEQQVYQLSNKLTPHCPHHCPGPKYPWIIATLSYVTAAQNLPQPNITDANKPFQNNKKITSTGLLNSLYPL